MNLNMDKIKIKNNKILNAIMKGHIKVLIKIKETLS